MTDIEQKLIIKSLEKILLMEASARSHNKLWQAIKQLCEEKGWVFRKKYVMNWKAIAARKAKLKDMRDAYNREQNDNGSTKLDIPEQKHNQDYYDAMSGPFCS